MLEDHTRPVLSLAVTDNKLFSGSYDYTIKVWSLDTLQRLKTLTGACSFAVQYLRGAWTRKRHWWRLAQQSGGESVTWWG